MLVVSTASSVVAVFITACQRRAPVAMGVVNMLSVLCAVRNAFSI